MDAKQTQGEPRLLISRSALLHNARLLRKTVGPNVKIWAMVKADGYGHGAAIVADTLCNFVPEDSSVPLVDQLAVASIEEAVSLPDIPVPITVLRPIENTFVGRQRSLIEAAIQAGWTLTIISPAAADDIARIAQSCGKRASVQIMLDTGMTRCGAPVERLENLLNRIESHATLRLTAIGTHFASSEDATGSFTTEQLNHFRQATDYLAGSPKSRLTRHAANSGGIFFTADSHLDAVRPGIALYGIDPTCRPSMSRPLRPVMKWTASLITIHDVKSGTSVGYNQTWQATRDTKIGLVPVGYADGYLRNFSNRRLVILVHGVACPVVGRVSMDFTTIDLHGVPDASIGDEVTILDNDPLSPCSAYALAKLADTIPYEIFCRIGHRVHRVGVEPEDIAVEAEANGV